MEDLQALEVALDERDAADDSARSTLQRMRTRSITNSRDYAEVQLRTLNVSVGVLFRPHLLLALACSSSSHPLAVREYAGETCFPPLKENLCSG